MASQSFQLVMKVGPTTGKVIPLTQEEMVVGRDASNDIVINDAEVSRRHAHFSVGLTGVTLEDLGSTNGTYVNGQRLAAPCALRPGDIVMFGEHVELAFEALKPELDATMLSGPAPMDFKPTLQQMSPIQQPAPAFSGQVPPGPAEPMPEAPLPEEKKKPKPWVLALGGCLLVSCCVLVVGAFVFDSLNLYCTSPFDLIFGFITTCP